LLEELPARRRERRLADLGVLEHARRGDEEVVPAEVPDLLVRVPDFLDRFDRR